MFRSRYCMCVLCAALGLALAALYLFAFTPSAGAAAPKGPVSFINDVAPILKKNCFGCHEPEVWDVAAGKLEKRVRTRSRRALSMAFLPDGKLVVAGGRPSEEGDVRIYDLNGGTPKMQDGVALLDGVNDKGVLVKHLY